MHPKLEEGLLLFDDQQYFEAQDFFKDVPTDLNETEIKLFKSLKNLNRGYCHFENGENEQAIALISDGYSKLRDLEKKDVGFSVNKLMHDINKVLHDLQNEVKPHIVPKIHFT